MITVLSYSTMPFTFEIFETDATKEATYDFMFELAQAIFENSCSDKIWDNFLEKYTYKQILTTDDDVTINVDKARVDLKIDFDELLNLVDELYEAKQKALGGNKIDCMISAIRSNNLDYDSYVKAFSIGDRNDIYIQFQDRESEEWEYIGHSWKTPKTSSCTWLRIWVNRELKFAENLSKYESRQKAIEFLQGYKGV